MQARKGKGYNSNPFEQSITSEEIANNLYGGVERPPQDRTIAKSIALTFIKPDPAQPRRAIPLQYNGSLRDWRNDAEAYLIAHKIKLNDLVRGIGDGFVLPDDAPKTVTDFVELCDLASSINDKGLISPISVWKQQPDLYYIEAGERRFMAHWLLNVIVGTKYSKIAAHVVDKPDVWRQAAENGSRKPLNAIGMARQLALLIMDMYADDRDVKWNRYDFFDGMGDRAYYAQVANGNAWRIKKGFGNRILQVTGLKSFDAVSDYRRLLNLPDEIWQKADIENWSVNAINIAAGWSKKQDTSEISDVSTSPKQADTTPPPSTPTSQTTAPQGETDDFDDNYLPESERYAEEDYINGDKPLPPVAPTSRVTQTPMSEAQKEAAFASIFGDDEPLAPPQIATAVQEDTTIPPSKLGMRCRDETRYVLGSLSHSGDPYIKAFINRTYPKPLTLEYAQGLVQAVSDAFERIGQDLENAINDLFESEAS